MLSKIYIWFAALVCVAFFVAAWSGWKSPQLLGGTRAGSGAGRGWFYYSSWGGGK